MTVLTHRDSPQEMLFSKPPVEDLLSVHKYIRNLKNGQVCVVVIMDRIGTLLSIRIGFGIRVSQGARDRVVKFKNAKIDIAVSD